MTRQQLLAAHPTPAVRRLSDLDSDTRVWTRAPEYGEPAHRQAAGRVAVCGAVLSEWPTTALAVGLWGGRLCPDGCWPIETTAGSVPAEMEER